MKILKKKRSNTVSAAQLVHVNSKTHPTARNAPMTRHLRRKRVPAQRTADRARRRAERFRERGVRSHPAGGDLLEERVDAFLVGADRAGGADGADGVGGVGGVDGVGGAGADAVR